MKVPRAGSRWCNSWGSWLKNPLQMKLLQTERFPELNCWVLVVVRHILLNDFHFYCGKEVYLRNSKEFVKNFLDRWKHEEILRWYITTILWWYYNALLDIRSAILWNFPRKKRSFCLIGVRVDKLNWFIFEIDWLANIFYIAVPLFLWTLLQKIFFFYFRFR